MSDQQRRDKMIELIKETKNYIDDEEVNGEDLLFYDHGFTSMDMLDLLFQMEQCYEIRIPEGTIYSLARGDMPDDQFSDNGYLTDRGREQLMKLLYDTPENIFAQKIHKSALPLYCTVDAMIRLVEHCTQLKNDV